MDFIYISAIGSISGTLSMVLVYIYLYSMYRERYNGAWVLSWLGYFTRIILFDSGLTNWKHSAVGFFAYKMLYVGSALMFIWSAHLFAGKTLKKYWIYGAVGTTVLNVVSSVNKWPISHQLAPPAWFAGIILVFIGRIFIHNLKVKGVKGAGHYITGYAFILWGIFTAILPFCATSTDYPTWIAFICGIIRLIIASGTLMVYFERTRADLVNSEKQYRFLAENAVDIIYYYKLLPEPKFEYVSPSVLTVTGHAPHEYYADPTLMIGLIHPNDLYLFNTYTSDLSWPHDLPLTFRMIRKNKNTIWVEFKFNPIFDETGTVVAREGIMRDVTARKELEHIVARFDKINAIGQMAVSVAHEIRNPLTTVRGYLQLLKNKQECSDNKNRYELMIEELDRTNTVISEYLLLSKDKVANLINCSLNSIINSLSSFLENAAANSGVYVKLDITEIPQIHLDETEIRQLLLNFVRNGIEAMPSGGEICIRTFMNQNKIVLSISDQGPGIPAHILNNLGTPFLTNKDTGTGLGLPMCYRIANRHNADICVETSNQGTTVFVYFNPMEQVA